VTRYSSLSALTAAALAPIFVAVMVPGALYVFMLAVSTFLIAKHHQNIRNLISGHESKIGQGATGANRA
jgi:glycerol-3-phosphate acyltransferase PlsY